MLPGKIKMNRSWLMLMLFFFQSCCWAQILESDELFLLLKMKDEALFKRGFNQCDLAVTASLISDDLEFYHDQGGFDIGKEALLTTMRKGLCQTGKNKINRHLIADSLQVYPLFDKGKLYGAIQMGEHNFAPPEEPVSGLPAKFIHMWLLVDEEWRLSRVMSYDHH
jgi:hypothetical protein